MLSNEDREFLLKVAALDTPVTAAGIERKSDQLEDTARGLLLHEVQQLSRNATPNRPSAALCGAEK